MADPTKIRGGTIILKCSCRSEYQDEKYGKDRRIHNISQKGNGSKRTSCGNIKR